MAVPRGNNVYGQLVAPDGLRAVLAAVERALGPGCASVYKTAGVERLRLRSDTADMETLPLPGGMEHLFNGAVAGSADEVMALVRSLSDALTQLGIEHGFEVLDAARGYSRSIP